MCACDQDPDKEFANHLFANCLLEEEVEDRISGMCSTGTFDSLFCETVDVEGVTTISDAAKEWLPYFCCEPGDIVSFKSQNSFFVQFTVEEKLFASASHSYNGLDECDIDPDLHRLYCIDHETAWVRMSSEGLDITLTMSLNIEFERPFSDTIKNGTSIRVASFESNGSLFIQNTHFYAIVDPGNLTPINPSNLEFNEELTIFDEIFTNVYTYTIPDNEDFLKMHYSKEYGLVGFVVKTGREWALVI